MFMIMCVLDDNSHLDEILSAWTDLGVSGTTIVDSTGLHRRHLKHIPMRYTYGGTSAEETGNSTLFAIVESQAMVQSCVDAVEQAVGDLDQPDTGVFSAWPLSVTKGVPSRGQG